jgi:hypothetical protein
MLEHLAEIAAINPAAAARAPHEMRRFILRLLADRSAEISASSDHRRGGSFWTNSGDSVLPGRLYKIFLPNLFP